MNEKEIINFEIKDKRDVLDYLVECRNIHQDYAQTPRICRGRVGSVKWHKAHVEKYQKCIDIISGLKEAS